MRNSAPISLTLESAFEITSVSACIRSVAEQKAGVAAGSVHSAGKVGHSNLGRTKRPKNALSAAEIGAFGMDGGGSPSGSSPAKAREFARLATIATMMTIAIDQKAWRM